MAITGWYVLYRDGLDSSIRKTDDFEAAIVVAEQLYRDGREVVQIGPLDQKRANEVIGASEIRRVCRSRAR